MNTTKYTLSKVSSIASSLNFSLPPFLRILSQYEASSSALEEPATTLLQNTSKASFRAYRKCKKGFKKFFKMHMQTKRIKTKMTLWNSVWLEKQSVTYAMNLSCNSIIFLTNTWNVNHVSFYPITISNFSPCLFCLLIPKPWTLPAPVDHHQHSPPVKKIGKSSW